MLQKFAIDRVQPVKLFPKKSLQGKYCLSPYVSVEIGINGEVHLCNCAKWMPTVVGNILENSLHEILANSISQDIRASIVDGTYRYCDESRCGIMANDLFNIKETLPSKVKDIIQNPSLFIMPREIVLAGDILCNLSCPSCRTDVIHKNRHPYLTAADVAERMRSNIFSVPTDQDLRLTVSTSGELFASKVLMRLVQGLKGRDFPNLKLKIQSNGILAPSRWHQMGDMANQVESITVTVDAAQADTYEKLRRGATWQQIQDAMSWLKIKKNTTGMKLHTRMIVQFDNFQQMHDFYVWSQKFDADAVEYCRIMDWFTFDNFANHDVFDPRHPNFKLAQLELDKVAKLPGVLLFGGLHTTG